MSGMSSVLLAGTGPASVQLAVLFKTRMHCRIAIAGRESVRSEPFFAALRQSGGHIRAEVQNELHRPLAGECFVDHVFQGYGNVTGEWDAVVLAVTTDAYIEVLKQIETDILKRAKCVVLISPTFGSSSLVRHYMKEIGSDAEIVSFSTYLGDTRWLRGEPSWSVVTTGVKRKVFVGSTRGASAALSMIREQYGQLGIALEIMSAPLEAETRNISLYVHPPLFMNEFALNAIFGSARGKAYVYKLFPEGPITPSLIRGMLAAWKEMTGVVEALGLQGVNLLKFMTDDNYPVRPESLPRPEIERFTQLEPIHQQYLLYVRYASLLIDPFSAPDEEGRYFDFSAVPIRRIFVNKEGKWDIPRMPKEDYYRIKIVRGIAAFLGIASPTLDSYIALYERALEEASRTLAGQPLSEAFTAQSFEEELNMICREIEASSHEARS